MFLGFGSPDDDNLPASAPALPPPGNTLELVPPAQVATAFQPPPVVQPAPRTRGKASDGSFKNLPAYDENEAAYYQQQHAANVATQQAALQPPPAPVPLESLPLHDLAGVARRQQAPQAPAAVVTDPAPAPSAFQAPAPAKPAATVPQAAAPAVLLPLEQGDEDEPAATPTVPAPPAAKVPVVGNPTSTPTASTTGLDFGTDGGDDETAKQQVLRDQAATNKFLRSQGVQMETTPTGQRRPVTDGTGNPQYKPRVTNPFYVGEDGQAYRSSVDAAGNEKTFRILDGVPGQDFHVDPQSGEQYVTTSGADGASKRQVLGIDPFIPLHHQVAGVVDSYKTDRDDAQASINTARLGSADAQGLGRLSLQRLRQEASKLDDATAPAQQTLSKYQGYLAANPNAVFTPAQRIDYEAAEAQVAGHADAARQLQAEIGTRESVLEEASQRHAGAEAKADAAGQVLARLRSGNATLRQGIADDMASAASGGTFPTRKLAVYQAAGLVDEKGSPTELGTSLLPGRGKTREPQVAEDQPRQDEDPQGYWQRQQSVIAREFPQVAQRDSVASRTFARAFQLAGSDPRKALLVARAVLAK